VSIAAEEMVNIPSDSMILKTINLGCLNESVEGGLSFIILPALDTYDMADVASFFTSIGYSA
jgi:hypothetical protein